MLLVLVGATLALGVATVVVAPQVAFVAQAATNLLLVAVGSIIVLRSQARLIGWLLTLIGFGFMLAFLTISLQERATTEPGFVDEVVITRLQAPLWWFVSLLIVLVLVFPTGRLVSPGWRWVVGAAFVAGLFKVVTQVSAAGTDRYDVFDRATVTLLLLVMVVAAVSLVVRYRRGTPVERRQVGWLAYAVFVYAAIDIIATMLEVSDEVFNLLDAIGTAFLPIAILIAIMRYRLFDIDQIVNRTLVYASVVALLAGVYSAAVFVLRGLLPAGSDFAVAASTLAVAAVFSPLRRRVQGFVDRRFYRSHYDAQRIVEEFSIRQRSEVDLTQLISEWLDVVDQAVKPASATVWIRSSSDRSRTRAARS